MNCLKYFPNPGILKCSLIYFYKNMDVCFILCTVCTKFGPSAIFFYFINRNNSKNCEVMKFIFIINNKRLIIMLLYKWSLI